MTKKLMTKTEALSEIYNEFHPDGRRSKAALKRLRRACEALGLNDEETRHVEYLADYRTRPDADVYTPFQD